MASETRSRSLKSRFPALGWLLDGQSGSRQQWAWSNCCGAVSLHLGGADVVLLRRCYGAATAPASSVLRPGIPVATSDPPGVKTNPAADPRGTESFGASRKLCRPDPESGWEGSASPPPASLLPPLFLTFRSREAAAALLQSPALIRTSDPPDSPSVPQLGNFPRHVRPFISGFSLPPPSIPPPFSSPSSSFICPPLFFLELSKLALFFPSIHPSDKSVS